MASDWWAIALGIVGGLVLIWLGAVVALWLAKPDEVSIGESLRLLPDLVRLLKRVAADPEMPRGIRIRLALLLVYLALPFDLIPDFVPVLGYADDAVIVALVLDVVTLSLNVVLILPLLWRVISPLVPVQELLELSWFTP